MRYYKRKLLTSGHSHWAKEGEIVWSLGTLFFRFEKFQFFPRFVPKQVMFSAILVSDLTPINILTVFVLK